MPAGSEAAVHHGGSVTGLAFLMDFIGCHAIADAIFEIFYPP